jgi:hypothetical protein
MLHTTFDSAWSPPIAAYEKLMDLGFSVKAGYYEPGMCYAGLWEDGDDDYYDLSEMNSKEVEDALPSGLDDLFGISETMAEYEAEQQEEAHEGLHPRRAVEHARACGHFDVRLHRQRPVDGAYPRGDA